jgi:hypothetical protein
MLISERINLGKGTRRANYPWTTVTNHTWKRKKDSAIESNYLNIYLCIDAWVHFVLYIIVSLQRYVSYKNYQNIHIKNNGYTYPLMSNPPPNLLYLVLYWHFILLQPAMNSIRITLTTTQRWSTSPQTRDPVPAIWCVWTLGSRFIDLRRN